MTLPPGFVVLPLGTLEAAGWRKGRESVRYPGPRLMRCDARAESA